MEVVKAFNDELFSINEIRGPVSRAKMAKITSSAIKAVRFYKHVVQSVEKFIQKGGADQKIPGLYVMDSIIRHSIHHFGSEKDVFAQRFAKNLLSTFQHLLQCKEDEKVKVVRVLQLWQKNSVFSKELIQQLLELIEKSSDSLSTNTSASPSSSAAHGGDNSTSDEPQQPPPPSSSSSQNELMSTFLQLLQSQSQSDKGFQINQLLQQVASSHPQLLPQLTQVVQLSQTQSNNSSDDPPQPTPPPPSSVHQPPQPVPAPPPVPNTSGNTDSLLSGLSSRLSRSAAENVSNNDKCSGHSSTAHGWTSSLGQQDNSDSGAFGSYDYPKQYSSNHGKEDAQYGHQQSKYVEREEGEMWEEDGMTEAAGHQEEEYRRSGVSDHWNRLPTGNDRKRRRSRERSRRSRSREKRRRSQSNERSYRSDSRERYSERVRGEMERIRRHLGLPMIEPDHVLICSTTLWFGHLNKHTTEQELRSELSNYGTVTSMNLIPPRGCAYVTFSSRKDACKALERMKGTKFLNNILKVAWAMGTGMKESAYKEFWNLEQGSFSIPWDKLDDSVDFDALSEGGYLDEASLSSELSKSLTERREKKAKEIVRPPVDGGRSTTTEPDANPPLPPSTPQCFPPPPPLPIPPPGMPPFMPPSGLMMGMPPIIMPPGMMNNPPGVLSPGQGSAPGQINSAMPVNPPAVTSNAGAVPPPFFPPMPPMWGPHQPPLPFPPSVPMRHPQPLQQPPGGNFSHDPKAEPYEETFGTDLKPNFNPNFPQSCSPFRPLRPPPMGNPRGGHRPTPLPLPPPSALNYTADTEEEYYEECETEEGNAFTPNRRFGAPPPPPPRFGRDPPQFFRGNPRRGRNNFNPNMGGGFRGRARMNVPHWGPSMEVPQQFGEDEYQEECEEENGEYYEEHQFPADWVADESECQEDFGFHGPPARWGRGRMGPPPPQWWRNEEPPFPPPLRGFQRGGNRWNNNRSRGFHKWGNNNRNWEQPQGDNFPEPEWNQESESDGSFVASWRKESEPDNIPMGRWGPEGNVGAHWGNEGEPDTPARWNKSDGTFANNGSQNNTRGPRNRHRGAHNTSRWSESIDAKDPVADKQPDAESLAVEPGVVDDNSAEKMSDNDGTVTEGQPSVEEKLECSLTGDASVTES